MGEVAEVLDIEGIAVRLRVKRATVDSWRIRSRLPEPDGYLGGSPVWLWATIRRWADTTGRLPKP